MHLRISAVKSWMRHNWIHIDPLFYLFLAFLLLTLPLSWLCAALCAAVFHELCHGLMLHFLGGHIRRIHIGIGGAVMDAEIPDRHRELICALAGPAGSFFLLSFHMFFPKLALCAGVQGLFNLLPIFPLDGGRALQCCLELLCPHNAEKIQTLVETSLMLCAAIAAALGTFVFSFGVMPLILSFTLILKIILRKRP